MRAVSNHNYEIWCRNTADENAKTGSLPLDNFLEAAAVFRAVSLLLPAQFKVELVDGETGEILADNG